jgi:hypothetical protein
VILKHLHSSSKKLSKLTSVRVAKGKWIKVSPLRLVIINFCTGPSLCGKINFFLVVIFDFSLFLSQFISISIFINVDDKKLIKMSTIISFAAVRQEWKDQQEIDGGFHWWCMRKHLLIYFIISCAVCRHSVVIGNACVNYFSQKCNEIKHFIVIAKKNNFQLADNIIRRIYFCVWLCAAL